MTCSFRPKSGQKSPVCQFRLPETDLVDFDGRPWCPFHLPAEAKKAWSPKARGAFHLQLHRHLDATDSIVDLTGVVFPCDYQWLHSAVKQVYLNDSVFCGDADFSNTRFESLVVDDSHFHGQARFDNLRISQSARFQGCTFERGAYFRGAELAEGIFEATSFRGAARFHGASIEEPDFSFCIFDRVSNFESTVLGPNATFSKSHFGDDAHFSGGKFEGPVSFDNVEFLGVADFRHRTFLGRVVFSGSKFRGAAEFDDAIFDGVVYFERVFFATYAHFRGSEGTAFDWISFSDSEFEGDLSFENRRFKKQTRFNGCTFKKAPQFHGCTLHQDTDFAGADFKDHVSNGCERAYRTLKLAMENVRSRNEEADFFAHEQKSLRSGVETPKIVKWFSWMYELSADYGRSFVRPALCWLFGTVVFLLIYLAILTNDRIYWTDFKVVMRVTLQQIFKPFELFSVHATSDAGSIEEFFSGLTIDSGDIPLLALGVIGGMQSIFTFAMLVVCP